MIAAALITYPQAIILGLLQGVSELVKRIAFLTGHGPDPITRHDGRLSVLRGFTEGELGGMVVTATGVQPAIRRRLGYRLTASWTPASSTAMASW